MFEERQNHRGIKMKTQDENNYIEKDRREGFAFYKGLIVAIILSIPIWGTLYLVYEHSVHK